MMLEWSGTAEVPIHILLTKADKFKRGAQQATMFSVKKQVPKNVSVQVFSAQAEIGKKILMKQIETWVDEPEETTTETIDPA